MITQEMRIEARDNSLRKAQQAADMTTGFLKHFMSLMEEYDSINKKHRDPTDECDNLCFGNYYATVCCLEEMFSLRETFENELMIRLAREIEKVKKEMELVMDQRNKDKKE